MTALTPPQIRLRKRRDGAAPLVMVTAYDEPGARCASEAGVDLILVGDSVANVMLGHHDTLHVTVEQMAHHVAAVASAAPQAHVVADLPWLSYHVSPEETVRNAAQLIRAGAGSVKLEGATNRVPMVRALINAEIPVMGHVGLTPQSMLAFGGFKVQAKTPAALELLLQGVSDLEAAGCYAIVVEGVPVAVGQKVTEQLSIPTIGIGAGPDTDGQVLVLHDLLGWTNRKPAKFVRAYADLNEVVTRAIAAFAADVRSGSFPADHETYPTPDELR